MQLVLTESEVASTLKHTLAEFQAMRERLESIGFPKPVAGLEDRWSIIEISNWVNRNEDTLQGMAEAPAAKIAHLRLV
jgi:hypothetical protein